MNDKNVTLENHKQKTGNNECWETVNKTREVAREFEKKGQGYGKQERFMDLVEEVGELAQAMLIVDGAKVTNDPAKARTMKHIADALSDILFDVVLLADNYEIDLFGDYERMLEELKGRLESGEFGKK